MWHERLNVQGKLINSSVTWLRQKRTLRKLRIPRMIDDAGRSLIAFVHSSHILAITRPFLQLSKGVMQTRTFAVLSKHLIQGPRMLDANRVRFKIFRKFVAMKYRRWNAWRRTMTIENSSYSLMIDKIF